MLTKSASVADKERPGVPLPDLGFNPDDYPSLDIVYEQVQRLTDITIAHADALDAKVGILLTAASFIVAGIAGLEALTSAQVPRPSDVDVRQALAFLAFATYLAVIVCGFGAYVKREYTAGANPRIIYDTALSWHPARTKLAIAQDLITACERNRERLRSKERWLIAAFVAALAECIVLGIILLVIARAL